MDLVDFHERLRFESWLALRIERVALARDKRDWFGAAPRPVDPEHPFCFALDRMKRIWRERDRHADTSGFPVHRTIGSTNARIEWFRILTAVIENDEVIRVRHRYFDEPVILSRESRFRALERDAFAGSRPPGATGDRPNPSVPPRGPTRPPPPRAAPAESVAAASSRRGRARR